MFYGLNYHLQNVLIFFRNSKMAYLIYSLLLCKSLMPLHCNFLSVFVLRLDSNIEWVMSNKTNLNIVKIYKVRSAQSNWRGRHCSGKKKQLLKKSKVSIKNCNLLPTVYFPKIISITISYGLTLIEYKNWFIHSG